jgi:hypothetical protein
VGLFFDEVERIANRLCGERMNAGCFPVFFRYADVFLIDMMNRQVFVCAECADAAVVLAAGVRLHDLIALMLCIA